MLYVKDFCVGAGSEALPSIPADNGQFTPLFCEPSGSTPLLKQKRLRKPSIICWPGARLRGNRASGNVMFSKSDIGASCRPGVTLHPPTASDSAFRKYYITTCGLFACAYLLAAHLLAAYFQKIILKSPLTSAGLFWHLLTVPLGRQFLPYEGSL